jgi:16S rRNA (guanine(1405)-N(7))-methyltransferase
MTGFLNDFFTHFGIDGKAQTCDLTRNIPTDPYDLALVLKTIPCLEQVDREAGYRLLNQINAATLLVSFPARSLGGKSKGMVQNYERHFFDLVSGQSWKITRFEFPGELAFLVQK